MWELIQQHSNKLNRGQNKEGRLTGKNGTGEGNGKMKIKMWKPDINCDDQQNAVRYMKKIATDSESIANGALQHKIWRPRGKKQQ